MTFFHVDLMILEKDRAIVLYSGKSEEDARKVFDLVYRDQEVPMALTLSSEDEDDYTSLDYWASHAWKDGDQ